MATDPSDKGSAILLDVENLTIAARRDSRSGRLNDQVFLKAALVKITDIARRYGSIKRAAAALSLPPLLDGAPVLQNEKDSRRHCRRATVALVPLLADKGFEVTIVPAGENAADWVLHRFGVGLAGTESVGAVVICTGDGGEPFRQTARTLLNAGKKIHIISYDRLPASLKFDGAACSLLAGEIRLALSEELPEDVAESSAEEANAAEAIVESSVNGKSALYNLKRAYIEVLKGMNRDKFDAERPEFTKLNQAIWAFQNHYYRHRQSLTMKEAKDVLRHKLPAFSDDEITAISIALVDRSDLFMPDRRHSFNFNSELLKKLSPQVSCPVPTPR